AGEQVRPKEEQSGLRAAWQRTLQNFWKRIHKIIRFTVPAYVLFFLFAEVGMFQMLEEFMAARLSFLSWLSPKAVSIIALQVAAEFTAGLAAAGALLEDGSMTYQQIILALLVGNVFSSPLRAIRHQFPYYAGIFKPRIAVQLIVFSQTFRAVSIVLVAVGYFFVTA
ncbi:MAG: hypothetical protein D3923_15920, partial [Candidatus Electrothrix sp. AR3]|nr:hypothetical protein [Candidatus Electrothrix sp. AR3]